MTTLKKVVITHGQALAKKYQASGLADIKAALKRLQLVDATRGIDTRIEYLDAPSKKSIPRVATASDERECKEAIDALYKAYRSPDYLMILGAGDVVPHQHLINPLREGDDDVNVPSDLPYACDVPYSRKIDEFLGPTRAVGRLPDVFRGHDVAQLIAVIDEAARFRKTHDKKRFVVSARVWRGATMANIRKVFGTTGAIKYSPADAPPWSRTSLSASLHFINCHGATSDARFFGEPDDFPTAHESSNLIGQVARGSIVTAECCFGAQLYAPKLPGLPIGIANTYLLDGAAAYCGSTNVAYGGSTAKERSAADVLCTQFLAAVVKRATTGRALLQARQELVAASSGALDPFDLKTLAQFLLLGDPSLRPFGVPTGDVAIVGSSKGAVKIKARTVVGVLPKVLTHAVHVARRRKLRQRGDELARSTLSASRKAGSIPPSVHDALTERLSAQGLTAGAALQFAPELPEKSAASGRGKSGAKGKAISAKAIAKHERAAAEKVQVVFSKEVTGRSLEGARRAHRKTMAVGAGGGAQVLDSPVAQVKVAPRAAVVARTRGNEVLSYRVVWSK
jgi:hypothetical protein